MPFGPQYSIEFGKTSGSMNGLHVWPAPNCPSSPYAWRSRKVVWPGVDAGAEQLELEHRLELADRRSAT